LDKFDSVSRYRYINDNRYTNECIYRYTHYAGVQIIVSTECCDCIYRNTHASDCIYDSTGVHTRVTVSTLVQVPAIVTCIEYSWRPHENTAHTLDSFTSYEIET